MNYQWAVIGAGPAGIAAVGKLIDYGVTEKEIVWIDPNFTVGDFGTIWKNVPSNTKIKLFIKFLRACKAFNYESKSLVFPIDTRNPEETCFLSLAAEPLQWVTNELKKRIATINNFVERIHLHNRHWHLHYKNNKVIAKNIILSIGAEPRNFNFQGLTSIPLQDAIDNEEIKKHYNEDTIAVFGSSHSAILVLKNLLENKFKKIINFYRSPLRYAVYLNDWILFDDSGLKGSTAEWARQYLDGSLPDNLIRVFSNKENLEHYLPQCKKVIYAVGFERRLQPIIDDIGHLEYIEQCGIIAPGLFGLGIAFPEAKINPIGIKEYRVGLWKFMEYLDQTIPIWLKYSA